MRFTSLASAGVALLGLAWAQPPAAVPAGPIRISTSPGKTSVTIETAAKGEYRAARLVNPERIYFDLAGAKLRAAQTIPAGGGLLRQVRAAPREGGVVRVVLDLEAPAEFTATWLSGPNRLEIDLRRAGAIHFLDQPRHRVGPRRQAVRLAAPVAVWPERERFDRICIEAGIQLADVQHQNGDLQAALQACQEALKIDPSREDIHRLAMQLQAEKGDKLGIIWQYQACCEALRAELDTDPSPETQALYRRLTGS